MCMYLCCEGESRTYSVDSAELNASTGDGQSQELPPHTARGENILHCLGLLPPRALPLFLHVVQLLLQVVVLPQPPQGFHTQKQDSHSLFHISNIVYLYKFVYMSTHLYWSLQCLLCQCKGIEAPQGRTAVSLTAGGQEYHWQPRDMATFLLCPSSPSTEYQTKTISVRKKRGDSVDL